jgi:hypothetical protein
MKAWKLIITYVCEPFLKQDKKADKELQLLEKDKQSPFLGNNRRKCLQYKQGERKVIKFLNNCCKKVEKLINLSA